MRRRRLAALGILAASAPRPSPASRWARRATSRWSRSRRVGPRGRPPPRPRPSRPTGASSPSRRPRRSPRRRPAGSSSSTCATGSPAPPRIASTSAAGQAANAAVDAEDVGNVQFAISGNGRYVVFASTRAPTSTPADTDAGKDVFRKDLQTGAVALVSVNSAGQKANAAVFGDPDVSYDGGAISFGSGAGDEPLRRPTATAPRTSSCATSPPAPRRWRPRAQAGVLANGTTERSAISADGQRRGLRGADRRRSTSCRATSPAGRTTWSSATWRPAPPPAPATRPPATGSGFPDISGDGRYVVFETGQKYDARRSTSSAGNDVYRRDMTSRGGDRARPRRATGWTPAAAPAASGRRSRPTARRVAFTSTSTDLVGRRRQRGGARRLRARRRGARRPAARARAPTGRQTTNDSDRGRRRGQRGDRQLREQRRRHDDHAGPSATPTASPTSSPRSSPPPTTTPPAIALAGATGTATDPSGIGEVTVNGAAVAVGAGGTFPVPVGPGTATVRAVDGAGNAGSAARTVTRGVAVAPPRCGRASSASGRRSRAEGADGALPPGRRRPRHRHAAAPDGAAEGRAAGSC